MAIAKFHFKFDDGEKTVEFDSGRSALWQAQDFGSSLPNTPSKKDRTDFGWGYIAAKQAGKLEELGIDPELPIGEAVESIADAYDLTISDADRDDAPLASTPGK